MCVSFNAPLMQPSWNAFTDAGWKLKFLHNYFAKGS